MGGDVRFPDLRREADRVLAHLGQTLRSIPFPNIPRLGPLGALPESRRGSRALVVDERFAALSFGKLWRWGSQPFRRRPSRNNETSDEEFVETLTPEQQQAAHEYFDNWRTAQKTLFEVDGEMLPYDKALKKLNAELKKLERSVGVDTFKDLDRRPDTLELLKYVPTQYLRRDSPKQQLKKSEEDRLDLTRISAGLCDKGIWGGKEFAFGIFARTPVLGKAMRRWRKVPFNEAVTNDHLLLDLIESAADSELTLMVVPNKKLSIHRLQWEYQHKLQQCMEDYLPPDQDTLVDLKEFVDLFDPERVARAPWVDGTRVKPDTQFIFSIHPDYKLTVEAINPGPLKDQQTTMIGSTVNPAIMTALFGLFLGRAPMDGVAKKLMTANVQNLANGRDIDVTEASVVEARRKIAVKKAALTERRLERMAVFVKKQVPATMTAVPA